MTSDLKLRLFLKRSNLRQICQLKPNTFAHHPVLCFVSSLRLGLHLGLGLGPGPGLGLGLVSIVFLGKLI